ncbi:MAG: sensor histidine kinase, partial [Candidatus Poribacteria bacterium]|nr:sensor histidine kinase [Candidatus Poribacteria bacterium]
AAGVGLSVEMASHDIMLLLQSALNTGKHLSKMVRTKAGHDDIEKHVDGLMAALKQVAKGMTDVQSLFKSTRRRRRMLEVEPLLDDTHRLYQILLEQRKVGYQKLRMDDTSLTANTTDGVIMLVLVNLFDNACYWLDTVVGDKEIRVTLSGKRKELIFADNGPGIASEDVPYIFDPFYSGKGEKGRGLGLYIARQLLERHDYRIKVADAHQKVLSGANFVISFKKEDI